MSPLLDTIVRSLVRTVTPWLVGLAVAALAKVGFDWQPDTADYVQVATYVSLGFYTLVRIAEEKLGPKWGVLLGWVGAPGYHVPSNDELPEIDEADYAEYAPQA